MRKPFILFPICSVLKSILHIGRMGKFSRITISLAFTTLSLLCLVVVLVSGLKNRSGKLDQLSFAVVCISDILVHGGQELSNARLTAPKSRRKSKDTPIGDSLTRMTFQNTKTFMHFISGTIAVAKSEAATTTLISAPNLSNLCMTFSDFGKYGARASTRKAHVSTGLKKVRSCSMSRTLWLQA